MEGEVRIRVLLGGLVLGFLVCLAVIAFGELQQTDALLLTVLLAVFSIIGSWIAAHHYAEHSFNKSVRLFALKAAEKVTNLSNELDRLALFLGEETKNDDYATANDALLARDLRIEAATHIIQTLKAANDRSLSDWQGVIGDELEAQREEREEREEEIRELIERLEAIPASYGPPDRNARALQAQIAALNGDIRSLASQITGLPVKRTKRMQPKRQQVSLPCASCGESVSYRQRPLSTSLIGVKCKNCGARMYSSFADGSFSLHDRHPVAETLSCPSCASELEVEVDVLPGTATRTTCHSCAASLRVFRTKDGVGARVIEPSGRRQDPELIDRVKVALPAQPWPKGIHRQVAGELGLSASSVSGAIAELIRRGDFFPQIDGIVYEPQKPGDDNDHHKEGGGA